MSNDINFNIDDDLAMSDYKDEEVVSDLMDAVPIVMKKAHMHGGVIRGIHEVCKALNGKKVLCCFYAKTAPEDYISLIQGLCKERNVPLIEISDLKILGRWAGLFNIDKEGEPRKIVGTSSVAITDFGEESPARNFLLDHIRNMVNVEA